MISLCIKFFDILFIYVFLVTLFLESYLKSLWFQRIFRYIFSLKNEYSFVFLAHNSLMVITLHFLLSETIFHNNKD